MTLGCASARIVYADGTELRARVVGRSHVIAGDCSSTSYKEDEHASSFIRPEGREITVAMAGPKCIVVGGGPSSPGVITTAGDVLRGIIAALGGLVAFVL